MANPPKDEVNWFSDAQADIEKAVAAATDSDDFRTAEGAIAATKPCAKHCTICEGQDHHWIPECDAEGEPLMVCKHCPAWREMTDADLDE